jgi:hypothetical protein
MDATRSRRVKTDKRDARTLEVEHFAIRNKVTREIAKWG